MKLDGPLAQQCGEHLNAGQAAYAKVCESWPGPLELEGGFCFQDHSLLPLVVVFTTMLSYCSRTYYQIINNITCQK